MQHVLLLWIVRYIDWHLTRRKSISTVGYCYYSLKKKKYWGLFISIVHTEAALDPKMTTQGGFKPKRRHTFLGKKTVDLRACFNGILGTQYFKVIVYTQDVSKLRCRPVSCSL